MKAPGIQLRSLSVGYGGKPVVSDVDVSLPGGRISMFVGPSGCGKTTVLRHVLGLSRPIEGEIRIGGNVLSSMSERDMECVRQRMGVLFQDGALLGSLTLADNVDLPLKEHTRLPKKKRAAIVREKLELVGLGEFGSYFPNQLSGGMRKRAGLARAMVMDPYILYCDEPTSGLDPINSAELDQLLLELNARFNMTVVVVSHDLASMRAIADYVVVLGHGRVLYAGGLEELEATRDDFLRRFLDRMAEERAGPRVGAEPLDPKVMKRDCSGFWKDAETEAGHEAERT